MKFIIKIVLLQVIILCFGCKKNDSIITEQNLPETCTGNTYFKKFTPAFTVEIEYSPTGVVYTSDKSILVSCTTKNKDSQLTNFVLKKFDSSGIEIWEKPIKYISGIRKTLDDNIYFYQYSKLTKMDLDGNILNTITLDANYEVILEMAPDQFICYRNDYLNDKLFIAKFDISGNKEWQIENTELIDVKMCQSFDGSLFFLGRKTDGSGLCGIMHIDDAGVVLSLKTIQLQFNFFPKSIYQCPDSSSFLALQSNSIAKIDSNGLMVWYKTIDSSLPEHDVIYSINDVYFKGSDEIFMCCNMRLGAGLIKLNENLDILWEKSFFSSELCLNYKFNDGFVIATKTRVFNSRTSTTEGILQKLYLIKTDLEGNTCY